MQQRGKIKRQLTVQDTRSHEKQLYKWKTQSGTERMVGLWRRRRPWGPRGPRGLRRHAGTILCLHDRVTNSWSPRPTPSRCYRQPPEGRTDIKHFNLSLRTRPPLSPAPHFSSQRCGCPPFKDSSSGAILAIGENIKVRELVLMGTALTSAWQRKSRTFSSACARVTVCPCAL